MDLKGKKINFLGDSITEGSWTSATKNRFSDLIAAKTGAICRNYGVGGTRIARQSSPSANPNYDRDFCSRVSEMDPDADIIVIFGGTNDYGHGDAPLGSMNDRTPYTFYGALHTLYRSVIEKYPDAQIIVITPTHRLGENDLKGEGNKNTDVATLCDYVNAIREVAQYYALPVLDLFAYGRIQPDVPVLKQKYTGDGLHPNDAGHMLIADYLLKFLNSI